MNRYDIVFIGQLGIDTIVPFEGLTFVGGSSPVLFASIAASCMKKRIAVVTRISENETYLLEPMKTAGVHLFVQPGEVRQHRIVFPTANVDQRQIFFIKRAKHFAIDDIPAIEPCLMHLCCFGPPSIQIGLIGALKTR
jgi:hypothetical protein